MQEAQQKQKSGKMQGAEKLKIQSCIYVWKQLQHEHMTRFRCFQI